MKSFLLILSSFILLALKANAGGYVVGNGGNQCIQEAYSHRDSLLRMLNYSAQWPCDKAQMQRLLSEATISCEDNLTLRGVPVDAVNIPDSSSPKIIFDRQKFLSLSAFSKIKLLFHETLGLAGIPDLNYKVSNSLQDLGVCSKTAALGRALAVRYNLPCTDIALDSLANLADLKIELLGDESFNAGDMTGFHDLVSLSLVLSSTARDHDVFSALNELASLEQLTVKLSKVHTKSLDLSSVESPNLAAIYLENEDVSLSWNCNSLPALSHIYRKNIFYYEEVPVIHRQNLCKTGK